MNKNLNRFDNEVICERLLIVGDFFDREGRAELTFGIRYFKGTMGSI